MQRYLNSREYANYSMLNVSSIFFPVIVGHDRQKKRNFIS